MFLILAIVLLAAGLAVGGRPAVVALVLVMVGVRVVVTVSEQAFP